ncbi:MAG: glycoside hydrolase family 2 [Clostridiales bacterium]|jgi:beta-galactosidase/beta-glucuronidase|nr:glycoside hydrolase family 2 [Clostridiales bacterium]
MNFTPRTEYPRPHFKRGRYQILNGEWEFAYDDAETGVARGLDAGAAAFDRKITVPFAYQTLSSGINERDFHEVLWYKREFALDEGLREGGVLLCFNAVDYQADVWVNGRYAGGHTGGYTAFELDITDLARRGEGNTLVVRATDRCDVTQPRGKQYWKPAPDRCWYHGTSGIWQSVWLEGFGSARIAGALQTADVDKNVFYTEVETRGRADALRMTVSYEGKAVKRQTVSLDGRFTKAAVELYEQDCVDEIHLWSPEAPNLYYLTYELLDGDKAVDQIETYFAFRKIHADGSGRICLNNKILYQRLVLDQGYWEDSDLTPPSAAALKEDILLAKSMGFNGARKHQKVEDPYFYYYADTLGFLVWGEMPSAYHYNMAEARGITEQYLELVKQLYNHPSVIVWAPLNESWGTRKILTDCMQRDFARSLYYATKAVDKTRLVSTNDGWENVTETDITSIHDYADRGEGFKSKYAPDGIGDLYAMQRKQIAHGERYAGQPVILTEYGGIALDADAKNGAWGYNGAAKSAQEFLDRLASLNKGVYECGFAGFCYTQLTDVKQEVNGLLDKYHKPKFDPEAIRRLNLPAGF